jgi:hypothetical protein
MNKKIIGGDGYSIDPNMAIGGLPSFIRYSNNSKPVFDGNLLEGGACGCIKDLFQGGGCGCNNSKVQKGGDYKENDKYVIDILLQNGGGTNKKLTQFSAIKEVCNQLKNLEKKSLSHLSLDIVIDDLLKSKPKKSKTFLKNMKYLQKKLLLFYKYNLKVLSSLLLLHYCAKNTEENKSQSGGDLTMTNSLSNILAPLGINAFGASVFLLFLQKSFMEASTNIIKSRKIIKQSGGNRLKNLIAPLGSSAFIATAILVLLERLFTNMIQEKKQKNPEKKKIYGSRTQKKSDELINVLSPLSFNTFAKESHLRNIASQNKK